MKQVSGGLVIGVDGPDGVGKSTQIKLLGDWLTTQGYAVHLARHSGGTPIGEALRLVSLSDTPRPAASDLYISLAMEAALGEDIQDRRSKGEICLIDRSPLAMVAYNIFGSQLSDQKAGWNAVKLAFSWLAIDKLIVFTAKPDTVEARLRSRTDKPLDFYEKQGAQYLKRVETGYRQGVIFAKQLTKPRISIDEVDANGSIEAIQSEVRAIVQQLL